MKKQILLTLAFATLSQAICTNPLQQFTSKITANRVVKACTKTTARKIITSWYALSTAMFFNDISDHEAKNKGISKTKAIVNNLSYTIGGIALFPIQIGAYPISKASNAYAAYQNAKKK